MKNIKPMCLIICILLFPAAAYADGGAISIPIALLIMLIGALLGVFLKWLLDKFTGDEPMIPICNQMQFVSSEKDGDDRICTYKFGDNSFRVSLNGIKETTDYTGEGCPDNIHPGAD